MNNLDRLQHQLRTMDYQAFLIPSTDEYLSEFAQPFTRRIEWITGFRGSTGLAIVLQERAALFLDTRYKLQGERDTAGLDIEILTDSDSCRHSWLTAHLSVGNRLALDTRLQSHPDVERILGFATERGIQVVEVPNNPIDALWGPERPSALSSAVIDYPTRFAGVSAVEKCAQLQEWLKSAAMDCYLLADRKMSRGC